MKKENIKMPATFKEQDFILYNPKDCFLTDDFRN